jgi:hypothetical protein
LNSQLLELRALQRQQGTISSLSRKFRAFTRVSVAKPIPNLISGRLLARNTIWNLFGQLFPMAVAVVAIPRLVRGLGVARFGVLSLAWIVVGYEITMKIASTHVCFAFNIHEYC